MSFRSTISRARLEQIRRAKEPTREEMQQAMREHPTNTCRAAQRAIELAGLRHHAEAQARSASRSAS